MSTTTRRVRRPGESTEEVKVHYINSDLTGWQEPLLVRKGTTIDQFLQEQLGRRYNASSYMIRVNRDHVDKDYVLEDGDRVTVTPEKMDGYIVN